MTSPMIIKFSSSAGEDLFSSTTIRNQIEKHFGVSTLNGIQEGNIGMVVTVFVDSATGVKFTESDEYQTCILDKVYSSSAVIFPKHIYIENAISGTLSIQVQ